MMKYLIIWMSLLSGLMSCSNPPNSDSKKFLDSFPLNKSVEAYKIEFDSLISVPMHIFVRDSVLVVNEFRKYNHEYLISLWNSSDGSLIKRLLHVGKGPDEFLPPLQINLSDKFLEVYERKTFSYTKYRIEENWGLKKVYGVNEFNTHPDFVNEVKEGKFLGVCPEEGGGRFAFYNSKGSMISSVGDYPEVDGINGFSANLKDMVFQGNCIVKPDKTKMVIASAFTGNIEIYNLGDSSIHEVYSHQISKKIELDDYSDNNVVYAKISKEHPKGFSNIFADDNDIYLLYSGENDTNKPAEFKYIVKIDWSGNPLMYYKLDESLECFTIDVDRNKLYGVSSNYDQLLIYNL